MLAKDYHLTVQVSSFHSSPKMASSTDNDINVTSANNIQEVEPVVKTGYHKLKKTPSKLSLQAKKKSINIPAILLVAFSIPASFLYGISLLVSGVIASPDACNNDDGFENSTAVNFDVIFIVQNLLVFVMFPIAGWLSDTKLGRYRTIYYSIWFMWSGVGVFGLSYVMRSIQPCDEGSIFIFGKYVFPILGLVVISIGAAGYFPNILAFIMEQLMESSNTLVRSYIYWFVWALFVGFFCSNLITVQLFLDKNIGEIDSWFIFPIMACFILFSVVLIVCFFFERIFLFLNLRKNPYSIVYHTICFAIKHKYPVNRSSLTYWEDELPGRLDLAKDKYGGPFKHEEVEDVKTLFRMIILFFSLLPFFVGYSGPTNQFVPFIKHLKKSEATTDIWFIYLIEPSITLVAIPVLELVILPIFPKFEYFIQKPLRWLFVGLVGLILCNVSLLIVDTIAHAVTKGNQTNCFINNVDDDDALDFDYRWTVMSTFFWGFCDLFATTSIFTFICSQAPYNMNGMLLGLFMLMQGFCQAIGNFITLGFGQKTHDFVISCGFWYWLTLSIVAVSGCVIFIVFAHFYKSRVRWEVDRCREIIENIYEKQLQGSTNTQSFSYYLNAFVVPSTKEDDVL